MPFFVDHENDYRIIVNTQTFQFSTNIFTFVQPCNHNHMCPACITRIFKRDEKVGRNYLPTGIALRTSITCSANRYTASM